MGDVGPKSKRDVARRMHERYLEAGGRREKTRLIDEFVELTGYDRTYAKVLLRGGPSPPVRRGPSRRAGRPAAYGPQVIAALRVCAESLDWPCGKRLVEILPDLAKALEREGERSSSSRGRYRNRLRRLRFYGDERGHCSRCGRRR